jgi:hypothetical protein
VKVLPGRPPRRRALWLATGVGVALSAAAVVTAMRTRHPAPPPLASVDHLERPAPPDPAPRPATASPATMAPAIEPLGLIEVLSTPPGATLYVDGKPVARRTPATVDSLAIGREHVVLAQLDGYKEELRRVSVPASGLLKLQIAFAALPGARRPASRSAPADRAPARGGAVAAPSAAARAAVPSTAASKATGRLLLNADPWAEAIVDGKPQGATPVSVELPVGPHTVVLVSTQLHQSRTLNIMVNAGQTLRQKVSFAGSAAPPR